MTRCESEWGREGLAVGSTCVCWGGLATIEESNEHTEELHAQTAGLSKQGRLRGAKLC
jgi:hypothetical protein